LVLVPRQHFDQEDKSALEKREDPGWTSAHARQRHTDASWTKKHGKSHFGYKLSVTVDAKRKLICNIWTGTASEHDSQHLEAVIDRGNTGGAVYAAHGDASAEREAARKGRRLRPFSARRRGPGRCRSGRRSAIVAPPR
jgi:IS5 family transposase